MASTFDQVAMTATAALIIAANTDRKKLVLKNNGSIVYIGSSSSVVDTANNANGGFPIESNEVFYLNDTTQAIYGICASGETSTLHIIEEELA